MRWTAGTRSSTSGMGAVTTVVLTMLRRAGRSHSRPARTTGTASSSTISRRGSQCRRVRPIGRAARRRRPDPRGGACTNPLADDADLEAAVAHPLPLSATRRSRRRSASGRSSTAATSSSTRRRRSSPATTTSSRVSPSRDPELRDRLHDAAARGHRRARRHGLARAARAPDVGGAPQRQEATARVLAERLAERGGRDRALSRHLLPRLLRRRGRRCAGGRARHPRSRTRRASAERGRSSRRATVGRATASRRASSGSRPGSRTRMRSGTTSSDARDA